MNSSFDVVDAGSEGNSAPQQVAQELCKILARLVEDPAKVRVQALRYGSTTVLKAGVASGDLGKVIGRQGRTIRSLRTLLQLRSERDGRSYELEIREPKPAAAP